MLLIIFSSFFVLLLPGAASPPPAPSSSRDSSSPALLPSFFTPSSPLLSPSFTVILLGRREGKEGGTKSGLGAPPRGREIPGLRGEKFSCRNSSQHGRRCLLLNPLSFAVPTQQPVPRAGGESPAGTPPKPPQKAAGLPRQPSGTLPKGFGAPLAEKSPGQTRACGSARQPLSERKGSRRARRSGAGQRGRAGRSPPILPLPRLLGPRGAPLPPHHGAAATRPAAGGGFILRDAAAASPPLCVCVCLRGWDWPRLPRFPAPPPPPPEPRHLCAAPRRAAPRPAASSAPSIAPRAGRCRRRPLLTGPAGGRPGPARPPAARGSWPAAPAASSGGFWSQWDIHPPLFFNLKGNKLRRHLQRLFPPHLDGDRAARGDAATSWPNKKVVKHHLLEDRPLLGRPRHRQTTRIPDAPLGLDTGVTRRSLRAALRKPSRF